jgi:uncharacterized protein
MRGYERLNGPISWLKKARLVISTSIVEHAALPLYAHAAENSFKLYLFDVGILTAMSDIQPQTILSYSFGSYQGYLAENFVAQELLSSGINSLFCWQGRTSEVEFLLANNQAIIPIEVKSGRIVHAKSLNVFMEKYDSKYAYILSGRNSSKTTNRAYLPLYAAGIIAKLSWN